jgi:hypothetical protein
MLDQRRAADEGFITLKEAGKIANYSPDYVGQLIRAGKIRGEQVYSQTAWVTTQDELQAYMEDKNRTVEADVVPMERFQTLQQISSYALYTIIALCAVALLFLQYVLYVSIDAGVQKAYIDNVDEVDLITLTQS